MPTGYSILEYTGDGSTDTFSINFTLGYLSLEHIQCRVADEVDGSGNPEYRTLYAVAGNPGVLRVGGTIPAAGEKVVFTRTVPKDTLTNDYADGAILTGDNLDNSMKQAMMAVHEALDGRNLDTVYTDIDMTGHKLLNVFTDPNDPSSLATVASVGDAPAQAAAAAQSAAEALQALEDVHVLAETAVAARDTATAAAEAAETARDEAVAAAAEGGSIAVARLETMLLSEAMKSAVRASDPDRSYLGNGWLDPLTDASQVTLAGLEFQAGDTGYIQPIPAATGLTTAPASATGADVKGNVTTLTIDTANTSGHFDVAKLAPTVAGCHVATSGGTVYITAITGDGTAANSVTISGTLAVGTYTVTAIRNILPGTGYGPGGYKLSTVPTTLSAVAAASGTVISGPLTWTQPAAAFDGTTSQAWGDGAYTPSNSTTPQYIGKSWGKYKTIGRFILTGSSNYGLTVAGNDTFYVSLQGSNDGTTWDTLYTSALLTDSNGFSLDVSYANGIVLTPYNRHRLLFTTGDGVARDWRVAEITFYEYLFLHAAALPAGLLYATVPTTNWAALNGITVEEYLAGQTISWFVSFDGGTTFCVWTGSAFVQVVRNNAGSWQYLYNSAWTNTPAASQNVYEACRYALYFTPGYAMTGATLNARTAAQFTAGGFTEGQGIAVMALLKTTDVNVSPFVSSVTLGYDRLTANGAANFVPFSAASPDKTRVVFVMQAVDDVTLDTDLKAFAKRGVGAWVAVPLAVDSQYDATRVLVTGEVDTPGSGDPESVTLNLTTYNRKRLKVFQIANYFKEVA